MKFLNINMTSKKTMNVFMLLYKYTVKAFQPEFVKVLF